MKLRNRSVVSLMIALALLLTISLVSCGGGTPKVDWTLDVSGAVESSLALSFADLADMPMVDLKDILMEKSLGEDEVGSWSGVKLEDIFTEAGVGTYTSVTAIAADGYAIEISKDELENAIVALKKDGQWITEAEPDKGPIRMVCPQTPANRWVFQLTEIQVNQ